MSTTRWTIEQAHAWHRRMPWLVGCNYNPRTAINQLEMWQRQTWDPTTIDQELGWAASLGFNSLRVFLHDLVWQQEGEAYLDRIERFLDIAARHDIGMMPVIFDSCWHPFPRPGRQREPEPHVHNSGWVQSPGRAIITDPARFDALEEYVTRLVARFARDSRVQAWDAWNEPCNPNHNAYGTRDLGDAKAEIVRPLLAKTFKWIRSADPAQPVTCGLWCGDFANEHKQRPIDKLQLEQSDVISFHLYLTGDKLVEHIRALQRYGRPLLCTEYMARPNGSTFESNLPILKEHKVAAYNWGFVAGRTQTHYPWDSWLVHYTAEPPVWFHDILHADGRAYRPDEVALIRKLTGKAVS
jgi:endo-1,4-beta-mannosidase